MTIAAREGGGNVDSNPRLRSAIEKAKAGGMPNNNIDRAIKRGTGELKDGYEILELAYEGYGPEGTAILVKLQRITKTVLLLKFGRFSVNLVVAWESKDASPGCSRP